MEVAAHGDENVMNSWKHFRKTFAKGQRSKEGR